MQTNDESLLNHLRELEVSLHQPAIRSDPDRLKQLLHGSFFEIGRSGQRYDRADIIRELRSEENSATVFSQDFELHRIDDDLALLTYKSGFSDSDGEMSRLAVRSSLWQRNPRGWQMRFHQGTPTARSSTNSIRAQYFFRQSEKGLLAWDVRRLVTLSSDFPVEHIPVANIAELDETHWYQHEGDSPTGRALLRHMQLIDEADLRYPIILDEDGRLMDGMHRVCKAAKQGLDLIRAVRFATNPDPDFVGCDPAELPYDD